MRKLLLAGLVSGVIAAPASADPTITFSSGSSALPSYTTASIFQTFESTPGNNTAYTPAASEAVTGDVRSQSSTVPGFAQDISADPSNRYLSIVNGTYSVSFASSPVQFFSFVLGTLDSYNSLTLNFVGGGSITYTGAEIIGGSNAGAFNSAVAGRVSYDVAGGAGITSAIFASAQPAFEIDSLASAVPEPATWALTILGFGAIGMSLRGRRKVKFAAA